MSKIHNGILIFSKQFHEVASLSYIPTVPDNEQDCKSM